MSLAHHIYAWLGAAAIAIGYSSPAESQTDGIRTESARPGAITELVGVPGFITTIEFGAGERIENIAIGDASLWQVTPNRRGNLVFVKPLATKGTTNMTVVTDQNLYNFIMAISSKSKEKAVFYLHLTSPRDLTSTQPSPEKESTKPEPMLRSPSRYTYNGSPKLVPADVFDDGVSTYFRFESAVDLPAVFVRDASKSDTIVNTAYRDGYVVVDQVARQFVLRRGNEVTFIVNGDFVEATLGPDSPRFQKGTRN